MSAQRCFFALLLIGVTLGGCAASNAVRILNLIGLSERPLVILHVAAPQQEDGDVVQQLVDPFAPYKPLRDALGSEIKRSVVPELCFGFQVEPSLRMGTSHLAVLSPLDYARLKNQSDFPIIAVPVDESGNTARPAYLVVRDDAAIERIADLKGKRVTFGPVDHPRTHVAAVALLRDHGLQTKDLSLEVLPVPGTLRHRGTGAEIARDIAKGATLAGFIDAREWDRLPETSSEKQAGRDGLRIVAETAALPNRLIIAAPGLQSGEVVSMRDFFLTAGEQHADALDPLRLRGFAPVDPEQIDTWLSIVKPADETSAPKRVARADG